MKRQKIKFISAVTATLICFSSFETFSAFPNLLTVSAEMSAEYAGIYTTKEVSDYLNVRSGAGTSFDVIDTIYAGETFIVTESDGAWACIKRNGYIGYVSADYIEKIWEYVLPNTEITGDLNNDGVFSISDAVVFQKFLLGVPDTDLQNWNTADLNGDGVLDTFDFCLFKKMLTDVTNQRSITNGTFSHYAYLTDSENDYLYNAEISYSEGQVYFRLINSTNYESPFVELESVAQLDYDNGECTAVFNTEYETVSIKKINPYTFEVIFNNNPDDVRSGSYYINEPYAQPDTIPNTVHDPKTPNGSMDAGIAYSAKMTLGLSSNAELTEEDCAKITELSSYDGTYPITSLDGIEYFKNLKILSISFSYISDISAINNLSDLEAVYFYGNPVLEEIPDLSGCTKLKTFALFSTNITDISPLADLPNLEEVYLTDNYIKSVAPLKDIHTIKHLSLDLNCISDWESIADNEDIKNALDYSYDDYLEIENRAKEILSQIITDDMSELEKEVKIAQYIEDFMYYDMENTVDGLHPLAYNGIILSNGVCRHYANTATYLMNLAGLNVKNCYSVSHQWNVINIDDEWYEFDCTWDDNTTIENWIWFNRSRAFMNANTDHVLSYSGQIPLAKYNMPFSDYYRYGF